jgi:hypothetical protein
VLPPPLPLRGINPACVGPFPPSPAPTPSPKPTPPPAPTPPTPAVPPFALRGPGGQCLAAGSAAARAPLALAPCASADPLQRWRLGAGGKVFLAGGSSFGPASAAASGSAAALCAKPQVGDECSSGMALWLGSTCDGPHGFLGGGGGGGNGTLPLAFACTPRLCLGHGAAPSLVACSAAAAQGWSRVQ